MLRSLRLGFAIAIASLVAISALAKDHEAIPGEFIVKLKQEQNGLRKKSMMSFVKLFNANEVRAVTEDQRYLLVRKPLQEIQSHSLSTLANHPLVEYAEPNYILRINKTPNDPSFNQTWGLNNTITQGVDVDVLKAWELTTGSKDIVVAVIDTGINYSHQDLAPNMWVNAAEKNGVTGQDDDGNGFVDDVYGYDFANNDGNPMDDHGHGSHCAGTIGANGDDGVGIPGVNWQVSLMAVKFLTAQGGGSLESAIKSIDYATKNKANIMSNSWGGGGFMQSLQDAIVRAKDAGILFVAAAGNDSANNDTRDTFPANYEVDNVLSVAAIDSVGALATFSNYGKTKVDIAAPGVDVYSTVLGNEYKKYSGTSMATPHVSGVAALLMAYDKNLSYLEVKERLMNTTKPLGSLRNKTAKGLVSAYNALLNQSGGVDPNDPDNWTKVGYDLSTPHPYTDAFRQTYEVHLPGAQKIAVFFSQFSTEYRFDVVTFKDINGKVLGNMSGDNNGTWSPAAEGDTIILEFSSDASITGYGFDITKIGYMPKASEPPSNGTSLSEDPYNQ